MKKKMTKSFTLGQLPKNIDLTPHNLYIKRLDGHSHQVEMISKTNDDVRVVVTLVGQNPRKMKRNIRAYVVKKEE